MGFLIPTFQGVGKIKCDDLVPIPPWALTPGKVRRLWSVSPVAAMEKQEQNKTESGQHVLIQMCLFLTLYDSRL